MGHTCKVFDFYSEVGRTIVGNFLFCFADKDMVGKIAAVVLWIGYIKLWGFEHIRHSFLK